MTNSKTEYSISNFSHVNDFIEEEEKFAQQFRKIQTARLFKRYALYGSLIIISLAILTLCIGTVYWLKTNDLNYLIGEKTIVENYNLSNTDAKAFLEDLKNQQEESIVYKNSVTKKFTIFQSKQFTLNDNTSVTIHVGWNFNPENFDYPYEQYCYLDKFLKKGRWENIPLINKIGKEEPKERPHIRDNLDILDINHIFGICRSMFKY